MKLRKLGKIREGDIVQLKGSTRRRKVHSVWWTENGDAVLLYDRTSPTSLIPAEKFEVVLPREQRICEVCDLYIYGPVHLNSSCQVR